MRWTNKMAEHIKKSVRSWLNVQSANPLSIKIQESLDYEGNAIRNRIWYRGDSNELQQLYGQMGNGVDKYKFWAATCSPGMEMRKIHTGLPSLIVDTLAELSIEDMEVQITTASEKELWDDIDKDNLFYKKLEKAVKDTLYLGDGAFKISFDTDLSKYPIIEFIPGDRIEIISSRGRVKEIIFKTEYRYKNDKYLLLEHYGYGTITYELYRGDKKVLLSAIPDTKNLVDLEFGSKEQENRYMMAVPVQFYESGKWEGRGQSIYDKKIDSFDALDEAWSQWMDALRAGRAKEYIPECMIPRNPNTGEILEPNYFDNRYIKTDSDMTEQASNKIDVEQPGIPHESYLATYVTALDLCLQGLISPSTLGIDMKKLDNADAQREKEKATLYTRDAIINALQADIPVLIETAIKSYNEFYNNDVKAVKVSVDFGEYANPSFESQIETISKARAGQVMSVDAAVDELYGDDKEDEWKKKEIARIKSEHGIVIEDEPSVDADGISIIEEGMQNEGSSRNESILNGPKGVQGTSGSGQGASS